MAISMHRGRSNLFDFADKWQGMREHEDKIDLAQQEMDHKNLALYTDMYEHSQKGIPFDKYRDAMMDKYGGNVHGSGTNSLRDLEWMSNDERKKEEIGYVGQWLNNAGYLFSRQSGGEIPGNRSGDQNLALLEDNEFVLNRNAKEGMEQMFGEGFLDYVNDEAFPRFQEGGEVDEDELEINNLIMDEINNKHAINTIHGHSKADSYYNQDMYNNKLMNERNKAESALKNLRVTNEMDVNAYEQELEDRYPDSKLNTFLDYLWPGDQTWKGYRDEQSEAREKELADQYANKFRGYAGSGVQFSDEFTKNNNEYLGFDTDAISPQIYSNRHLEKDFDESKPGNFSFLDYLEEMEREDQLGNSNLYLNDIIDQIQNFDKDSRKK